MTNHRRRMQTRNRNISVNRPWWSNPEWHNADVARRKRHAELSRWALRVAHEVGNLRDALAGMGTAAVAATDQIRNFGTAWSTLDQLAAQGWDVREDMDALAAEEAEATRQENDR